MYAARKYLRRMSLIGTTTLRLMHLCIQTDSNQYHKIHFSLFVLLFCMFRPTIACLALLWDLLKLKLLPNKNIT